ncbi:MAG: ABC transporter substrate-binding protein [Gammaproteobacteria bacterium]
MPRAHRRFAWVLFWVAVFLQGCAQDPGTSVVFAVSTAPSQLDPRFATDATSARVNRLLYGRLVDFDARSEPRPALADWERISPVHYRFRLSSDERRFHDGGELTSADVAATYRYILDPANGSPHRAIFNGVARIETPDPDTVEFHLRAPDPLFPGYLVIGIVPQRYADPNRSLGDSPVGSGPFAFVQRDGDQRVSLRRVVDGLLVEFVRVKDPTVRVLKLIRGEADIVQNNLPPELVAYLSREGSSRIDTAPGINFSYLGFNLTDPVTGRREVREAIAHAIDREAIIEHLWGGTARPAEALLVPENWAGHRGLSAISYDPDRARSLLAALGHGPDNPLRLSYKTSTDPLRIRIATAFQQQLSEVGIELDIRSYDWGTFFGDIKAGRFQLYSLTWVGIRSPDIFEYVFHSTMVPPTGANRGRYLSDAADRLIGQAQAALEREEQAALYRELQALLHRDLPYIPLWYEDNFVAQGRRVSGYMLAPDGNFDGLAHVRLEDGS